MTPASHQIRRERRVAGYAVYPFFRKALDPIVGAFNQSLISDDIHELLAFEPDVVVVPEATSIPEFRDACDARNIYVVGLRHGGENKYIGPEPEYANADFICGSEWDLARFQKFSIAPRRDFLLTGNAWVDGVFRLPQRPARRVDPTILFAPTYHPETCAAAVLGAELLPLIRTVYPCSRVVIKPHPHILRAAQTDDPMLSRLWPHRALYQRWVATWEQDAKEDSRVQFVTDPALSITALFADADILISDGSSLILEFMALNRPMLLAKSKEKVGYWTYDDEAPGNAWRDMGIEFADHGEFITALRETFARHDAVHAERQRHYTRLLHGKFQDGRSCERVVAAIRDLPWMDVAPWSGNRSPLALKRRLRTNLANTDFLSSPSELASSDARYALLIDALSDSELVRGQLVTQSQLQLDHDSKLCSVGRLENGTLCRDFSIHSRARLLGVGLEDALCRGGVDSDAALTEVIHSAGLEFSECWNARPCAWFGDGFHADEGGTRWMRRSAHLLVGASVYGSWAEARLIVSFTLRVASAAQYPVFPLSVRISRARGAPDVIATFTESHEARLIELPVTLERGLAQIDFESGGEFSPASTGESADQRLLAAHLSNLQVRPAPIGVPLTTASDGFYEPEGDGRWMSTRATIIIPEHPALHDGGVLRLKVSRGQTHWYPDGPPQLSLEVDGQSHQILIDSDGDLEVSVPLARSAGERVVALSCSSHFVPSQLGQSADERKLALFVRTPLLIPNPSGVK